MNRPQIRIYTGEGEFIDREMNDAEYAQYEKDQADTAVKAQAKAQAESKREAALNKLAALGLTTDDFAALGL
jgi:hypothetical protein